MIGDRCHKKNDKSKANLKRNLILEVDIGKGTHTNGIGRYLDF